MDMAGSQPTMAATPMNEAEDSLWHRVGGDESVCFIIDVTLDRMCLDEAVAGLIEELDDEDGLFLKMKLWLAKVMGGPVFDIGAEDLFGAFARLEVRVSKEQMDTLMGIIVRAASYLDIQGDLMGELQRALARGAGEALGRLDAAMEAAWLQTWLNSMIEEATDDDDDDNPYDRFGLLPEDFQPRSSHVAKPQHSSA